MPLHARQGVVFLPFSGTVGGCLGRLLCPALGRPPLGEREKSDWVVSHGALPGRVGWVTFGDAFL